MLQTTLDRYMIDEGVARYRNGVTKARERGEESKTRHGQKLLSHAIIPFAEAIEGWLKEVGGKRANARGAAYLPMTQLSPQMLAFLAAKGALDVIGKTAGYAVAAGTIGGLVEDEIRFSWFKKHHYGLFRSLEKQLDHCMSYDHKRVVIIHCMNKQGLGTARKQTKETKGVFNPWDEATRVKVGIILLDLFEKSTGLVSVTKIREGRKTRFILQATQATMDWIRGFSEYAELLDPVWLPTVNVPTKWTGPYAGGYSGEGLPVLELVKRAPRAYLDTYCTAAVMPDVYTAINALQETSWKINHKVFSVLNHFWGMGRAIGSLPKFDDDEIPEKPEDIATNEEARTAWKRRAARTHKDNASTRSMRIQARKLINLAQKFANTEKFYFPYQLDFRGRVYTVSSFLTPQGSDLARSLLLFADGVTMLNDQDAYWLAVYGANLFGKDKITFEARIEWVKENEAAILGVAKDPLANQWWQEADSPWQFLAWCLEWAGWRTQGAGFKTCFPVCLDGTNNGLQLLSMLMRDEVAGLATNVLPSASPADIYGEVALRVVELMKQEDAKDKLGHAEFWLEFGIDRKTTKRPVMVLPYGGTFHSCREYVADWYMETAKARGLELPEFKLMAARNHYLAQRIWDAIEFCVGRPREAMTWLQECAGVFSKADLPIVWTSPSGFPVLQAYKEWKSSEIATTLGDRVRTVFVQHAHPTKLSKSRQKNGISPNFVHSCDAAALVKTVALSLPYGLTHFAMIHDSYGTHAPKVHEMAAALRAAFVTLFTQDTLNLLRDQFRAQLDAAGHPELELPPVPEYGTLKLDELYNSEFFFA